MNRLFHSVILLLLLSFSLASQVGFRKPLMLGQAVASQFNWKLEATVNSTPGGNGTITFDASYWTLPDSVQITPWRAGLPVTIEDGSATETVDLTTVSCRSMSNSPCTADASFAFAHKGRMFVQSGTGGLQESVNYLMARGGGTVVIDRSWVGPDSTISSIQGAGDVLIQDIRSGRQTWYSWAANSYVRQMNLSSASVAMTAVMAQSVNGVLNAAQYAWTPQVNLPAFSAGALITVTPVWASLPSGLTSGAVSIVSESTTSNIITWVSGDKFNSLWATGKPVNLDGDFLTITSCSTSTSCTLSADAPRTTSYGWAVIGLPTSIYISGGICTAESVDVLGIGSECAGGNTASLCFIPSNAHSGAYSIQSATDGIQEAINQAEAGTTAAVENYHIYIPAGNYSIYAPIWISRQGVSITGAGARETHLEGQGGIAYSGPAHSWLTEYNLSWNGIRSIYLSSTSGMNGISWTCTTGGGGCGNTYMQDVQVDGASGMSLDDNGVSMKSAGVYIDSMDGIRLKQVYAIYNNDGVFVQYNGGGSGMVFSGGDYSNNADDGLNIYGPGITAINISGNRIFNNSNNGIYADNNIGMHIHGNHFEANKTAIAFNQIYGITISGNLISQHIDSGAICFICGNTTGNASLGVDIAGNEFRTGPINPFIKTAA